MRDLKRLKDKVTKKALQIQTTISSFQEQIQHLKSKLDGYSGQTQAFDIVIAEYEVHAEKEEQRRRRARLKQLEADLRAQAQSILNEERDKLGLSPSAGKRVCL